MSEPGRPPLPARTLEAIDQLKLEADQIHWPLILAFQVQTHYPLHTPVPPPTPQLLMGEIRQYATVLFKLEADQYEKLRNTGHYADWLFRLVDRVVSLVLKVLERLNDGGPSAMLLEYHGLSLSGIAQELKELLQGIAHHYQTGTVQVQDPLPPQDPKISTSSSIENSATDLTPIGNRERIDGFILKMAKSGLKIKRNDIWHAAGYKDRTEFERFQRGESRNQTAFSNFNRILSFPHSIPAFSRIFFPAALLCIPQCGVTYALIRPNKHSEMLKWLAILAVILTIAQTPIPTAGQTTNRSSSDGQKQDQSGDNHKNPSPATPRIVVKKASDGEDKTESQKAPGGYQNTAVNIANSAPVPESWPLHDRIAWGAGLILVLAGIAGTGIGVCTLWVLRRQTKANWAAAKAALKQANHIVTSERAWVLVCKIALTAGAIDHLEGSKQCFVSCAGKNYGKTPARVLGMNVLLASGPIADPEKSWDENLYDFSGKDTPKWIIVPSIPKPMYGLVKGFTTNPGDELPTPSVGEAYFVHGIIRYWDAFSETDRFTRFCYREDRDGSLLGKGWHVAGGERCNQET